MIARRQEETALAPFGFRDETEWMPMGTAALGTARAGIARWSDDAFALDLGERLHRLVVCIALPPGIHARWCSSAASHRQFGHSDISHDRA